LLTSASIIEGAVLLPVHSPKEQPAARCVATALLSMQIVFRWFELPAI
jgi:hypothetical protein